MRTVSEITEALFSLAPAYMKEEWDNVGLLCGHGDRQVQRILVALDPFLPVAEEAKAVGADLLVTHHPLIFFPVKSISDGDAVGQTILFLIENGIAAVNMHTNLDSAPGGVNDCLAEVLGLRDVQVLVPAGTDEQGRAYGLCRYGTVDSCSLPVFLKTVKEALGCGGLRYADSGRAVSKVAVGGGACGEFLKNAVELGCDTFVTADLKYNAFADAAAMGINLIDAGHFPTEDPVCNVLVDFLRKTFPELDVIRSKTHRDAVNFL